MATPMHPVTSSHLSYIGYDEDTKDLFIRFKMEVFINMKMFH
jgi:hypothetical protein